MFAELPPSSSELTERKALFRHLLLQIGGANIEKSSLSPSQLRAPIAADRAGKPPSSSGFPYARGHKWRLGDYEGLLTAPDVHSHDVIVIEACLNQREGYADLEGR
jgi:hypothetical protein